MGIERFNHLIPVPGVIVSVSISTAIETLCHRKFLTTQTKWTFYNINNFVSNLYFNVWVLLFLGMSIYLLVNQVEAVMVSFITTFCLHVWHARKHRQTNTKIFCGCAMIVKVHWEINTFVPAFVSLFPFENLFWLVNLISKLFIWCPLMFLFDNRTVDFRPGEKRNNSQQNCTSQSFKKNTFFLFCECFCLSPQLCSFPKL